MADSRKMIILVDDNQTNLKTGQLTLQNKYNTFAVPSAAKMFKLIQKALPDLILLDIEMPEMNGLEALQKLKEDARTKNIPVIFLSAKSDARSELAGLELGAIDFIGKPFSPPLLLKRLEVHLQMEEQKRIISEHNENLKKIVAVKTRDVVNLQNAILKTVADLVECRDDVTGGHIERTQYSLAILVRGCIEHDTYISQLRKWDLNLLVQSAQLHDVGKIQIRDSVLLKPGRLTDEEFGEMKLHTVFGIKIIDKIVESAVTADSTGSSENGENGEVVSAKGGGAFLRHAKVFAGTHHERWDGKGYPYGLAEDKIPLQGRLMAISDVYDALVSKRPYKRAFTHEEAANIILEERGKQFDPLLVDIFEKVADRFRATNEESEKSVAAV